jgi:hypothetical protein
MMALAPLAFLSPWALAALAVLPALWWLLRVTPPAPRLVRFPAVRLLFGLEAREDAAARTPPWVLALRLGLAACIILAVAGPVINPGQPVGGGGPLLVAVDDGWAAARDWPERRAWLDDLLARAGRGDRPVIVVPTAPAADGTPPAAGALMPAAEARAVVDALQPRPWPTDRAAAARTVAALAHGEAIQAVWLADGLDDGGGAAFLQALQTLGGRVEVVTGRTGRILMPAAAGTGGAGAGAADPIGLSAVVRRSVATDDPAELAVRAVDDAGRVVGRQELDLAPGQAEAIVTLRLPTELRNKLVRLDIENERGAAAVLLLDERWRRRPVGLAAGGGAAAAPLLGPLYYVGKALEPVADLHDGDLGEMLDQRLSALVLADVPVVPAAVADRLDAWIRGGGVLIRFAGPLLANAASRGGEADRFLPVRLRAGGRSLGGAMSWTAPMALGPFAAGGPFAGLGVPDDVKVSAQVLAEPSLELAGRTWASLADGTPLVTAERRGGGWVVLVHTSANAEWSTLALSGLFPEMLHRLVLLSQGVEGRAGGVLAPVEVLDGFGRLGAPAGAAAAIDGDSASVRPGPLHPPGLYGGGGARVALNLGAALGRPAPLVLPAGVARSELGGAAHETDLAGPLLALAAALAVIDLMAALGLRGLLRRTAPGTALVLALALGGIGPARAANDESFALRAGLQTRLAYVRTGDAAIDRKSEAGLAGLTTVLAERSTAVLAAPMAVDVEADPVLFFPLLYWPVAAAQAPPSPAAAAKLQSYLRHGGLIVFDTADGDPPDPGQSARLQALVQGLALPPLAPLTAEHVLTRAFYLLKETPGRFDGGTVWVEDGRAADNDGVSPVVVGGEDWAGAWAEDAAGRPLYAVVPGGDRQREMAFRFGINLVMYALTGNYKADQVHLPAILERLGR